MRVCADLETDGETPTARRPGNPAKMSIDRGYEPTGLNRRPPPPKCSGEALDRTHSGKGLALKVGCVGPWLEVSGPSWDCLQATACGPGQDLVVDSLGSPSRGVRCTINN